jgi:hypothetical protein
MDNDLKGVLNVAAAGGIAYLLFQHFAKPSTKTQRAEVLREPSVSDAPKQFRDTSGNTFKIY